MKIKNTISAYNFNSHAHVERDIVETNAFINPKISTHTLTWSVTQGGLIMAMTFDISTHTLTWSVTLFQTHPNI